jgi:transposase
MFLFYLIELCVIYGSMATGDPMDLDTYPTFLIGEDGIPVVSQVDWQLTPKSVRALSIAQHRRLEALERRVEQLEGKYGADSSNSDKPPSTDSPFKKKGKKKGKAGARKGHRGHRQQMLDPTESVVVKPKRCGCGCGRFKELRPFYLHQEIELPEIRVQVTHFVLHRGRCARCGRLNKAQIPDGHRTGYGPRLTALVGEMAGIQGNSRTTVQEFLRSVLNVSVSKGAIQKMIDRSSRALKAHHEAIGDVVRGAEVNFVDETSWWRKGALEWLWAMVNAHGAHFVVHPRRSREAFEALVQDWHGTLVSDGYGLYRKWPGLRQSCLAHLIRKAKGLAERKKEAVANFGRKVASELGRLCEMARGSPTVGRYRAWYARFSHLIAQHTRRKDEAGKFARRLLKEMDSLVVFLYEAGVEPTNNRAERALRFGVLWRKRSQGTDSEKGDRWVERVLSLKQTCRIRGQATYPILVDAVRRSVSDHRAADLG